MMKKSVLLATLTVGIAIPTPTIQAKLSGPEIAGLAVAGAAALFGVYAIGKQCDVWGNPNPDDVLRQSTCILEQVIQYRNILDVYITAPSEDFLYTLAIEDIHIGVHSWQLENQSSKISECVHYMQDSRHYCMDRTLQEQLRAIQCSLDAWTRDLRSFEDYLCKHAPYFALFAQEKRCLNAYAQEVALYNSYAYNPEYLKNQLYQQAQCKYHDAYAMISYIKQLERDINALQNCINKALGYNRAAIAHRILDVMRYLHQLVVNDPSYTRLVNDYHRYKAEQERLRMERERLEIERIQAAAERARLARERAEYAAQLERERLAREILREKKRQNDALDYEKQRLDAELKREYAHQAEQQKRAQAEIDRQRKENERIAREQERRCEQERQESARRRDAERRAREAEDAARIAKYRETEKKDPYRDYDEQERQRKKRKREEAEEARKKQEARDEQYRYEVFDRFA